MMSKGRVDPLLLNAWLSARSIARGLPLPDPEYGGFRVDTNSDAEVTRWVFPKMGLGREGLARSINQPRYFLKLCGAAEELRSALPIGWELHAPSYFMQARGGPTGRHLTQGYRIQVKRVGMVSEARIFSETGALCLGMQN